MNTQRQTKVKIGIKKLQRDALMAIEIIVGDEQCEEWDMEAYASESGCTFTEREKKMHEKISLVYRISHACIDANGCFKVHDGWRKLVAEVLAVKPDPNEVSTNV